MNLPISHCGFQILSAAKMAAARRYGPTFTSVSRRNVNVGEENGKDAGNNVSDGRGDKERGREGMKMGEVNNRYVKETEEHTRK